ncbi:hypothetical protein Dvina_12995 [Dactylosporangium vinaceum]|uniref:DUF4367 domain-containing protein n=1 Tax=Dactylosporangium vinaceum TaxID=53362 RepID=A0ABV5MG04_9ACTN|nr:hypothetical protein [Dactylosporangium vinaceum]UAB98909.1 hypothetical protein Dvina_12995 [Dactylosporangium vinaceum]
MSDEEVIDLFDRAVAEVPPALLPAPHAAIRRRVRRRRATGWGAATAAVLAVVAGFAVARADRASDSPQPAASREPAATAGVPWAGARIDRAGTRITVYAVPRLGKCVERDPAHDDLVLTDDKITMSLDGAYTGCADDTQVTARTFELPQAAGTRLLADGRSPWGQPFIFSDTDLPDLAAGGWSEQPPSWLGSGDPTLALRFTRPGGPDLRVLAVRSQPEPGSQDETPDHALMVNGKRIDVYGRAGRLTASWWSADAGAVHFTMDVSGAALGVSEFDAMLRGLTWA